METHYAIIAKDKTHEDRPTTMWLYESLQSFKFYSDYHKKFSQKEWEVIFEGEINQIKGVAKE